MCFWKWKFISGNGDGFLEMEIYFRKRERISGNGNVFLNMEMDFRKLFPSGKYIEFPGNSNNASYVMKGYLRKLISIINAKKRFMKGYLEEFIQCEEN
jgi:hypothetical protein